MSDVASAPGATLQNATDDQALKLQPTSAEEKVDVEIAEYVPPNGGFEAWFRTFAAWIMFLISWGPALTFGDFQSYYVSGPLASKSVSTIAWIGSLSTLLLITTGVVTGPLFDRGYLKPMMVLGSILLVFGYMMTSLCTKYYQFILAQGVCAGVGSGLLYVPALAFVSTSFTTKRPIAVGLTVTGASTGGIIFPIMFRKLLPELGFGWTVRTMAFVQLGLAIIALGILAPAPVVKNGPRSLIDTHAFREVPFMFLEVMFFFHFMSFLIPLFFIPAFTVDQLGGSPDLGSNMLVIANAGTFLGRLFPALIAQRIGAMNVAFGLSLIVCIINFCWIAVDSIPGMVVWSVMWGLFAGGFSSIDPVVVTHPKMSPTTGQTGARLGMAWFAAGIGMLIGSPVAGAIGGQGRGYLNVQILAGATLAGGGLFALVPWWYILKADRAKAKEARESEPSPDQGSVKV